jgi:hypothetical protein
MIINKTPSKMIFLIVHLNFPHKPLNTTNPALLH